MKARKYFSTSLVVAIALTIFLSACGENRPGKKNSPLEGPAPTETKHFLNGAEFLVLEQGSLRIDSGSVSGSGKITFKDVRPSGDSNFDLAFSLEDHGSLSLITNAGASLEGVAFTFKRTGAVLHVSLAAGSENYILSSDFTDVVASSPLSFSVDVHSHGHVVVWVGSLKLEYAFSTQLPGKLWGLTLDKATITKAAAGPAKAEG